MALRIRRVNALTGFSDGPQDFTRENSRRIDPFSTAEDAMKALAVFGAGGAQTRSLDPALLVLVKMHVAQMNASTYCIEIYRREAQRLGADDPRFSRLPDWRDSSEFTHRERAGLAWAEAVTQFAGNRVPDCAYEAAQKHFPGDELVALSVAIVAANAWCQIAVTFRLEP